MKYLFFLFFFVLFSYAAFSQGKTKVELVQANALSFDKNLGSDVRRLLGNVVFKHDQSLLYCDSAYFYTQSNTIIAYSHVRIRVSDSVNVYGDNLFYNGNTKLAKLDGNVRMTDKKMVLTTTNLDYNLETDIATYPNKGKIVSEHNVLTSDRGFYYANERNFYFKDNVVLKNPSYTIKTDTLRYNTTSEIAYFLSPTLITGKDNSIYCENGNYQTKKDIAVFDTHVLIKNKEQTIRGDSIYYEKSTGIGKAYYNVELVDEKEGYMVKGDDVFYNDQSGEAIVTKKALLVLYDAKDTLSLHADTIHMKADNSLKENNKTVYAYRNAVFYRNDLQGRCDSLVYSQPLSSIELFKQPILWSDDNQMTADSITILMKNNQIHQMLFKHNGFIASQFDSLQYNQIKGRLMTAYFSKNKLAKVHVKGNAETIYFVSEEDSSLVGVNKSVSSNMMIYVKENKIQSITLLEKPNATLFPAGQTADEQRWLKGFIWYQAERPRSKEDIY